MRASRERALVFLGFCVLSAALYGGASLARLSTDCIPTCEWDPNLYTWMFAWLRWAVLHGANPFHAAVVGGPSGVPLHWVTTVTAPAALALPLTAMLGPRAALNLTVLLAPAVSAWCAYLLCRDITGRTWPAIVGGLTFGFSSYTAFELFQLNLLMVFPLPLAALLVRRLYVGSIRPRWFVASMSAVLLVEFLTSIEIFATMTLFGGIAFLCYLVSLPREHRRDAFLRAAPLAAAYVVVGVVLSPILISTLSSTPREVWVDVRSRSGELFEIVVPSSFSLLGRWFGGIRQLAGVDTAVPTSAPQIYLGLPLVTLLVSAWWRPERHPRFLLAFAGFVVLCSMGPSIQIGRGATIPGPYALLGNLPLLSHAFPKRFPVYVWLVAAVIVAQWLAGLRREQWMKGALLVAIGGVLLAPARARLAPGQRLSADASPVAFSSGAYRWFIGADDDVLALSTLSKEIVWHAEADLGFRLAEGYLGPYAPWGFEPLQSSSPPPVNEAAFRSLATRMDLEWVALGTGVPSRWRPLLEHVSGLPPIRFGGIDLYRVGPAGTVPPVEQTPDETAALARGGEFMIAGRFTDAAAEFRKVLALDPRDREAHFQLARVYFAYGSEELTEVHLRAALVEDPRWTPGLVALARLWAVDGRPVLADRLFARIASIDPSVLTADELARARGTRSP